jgi:tetratricopeptide (TPR) repeat protein
VGTSLNNLALLYTTQGEYAEAEPLHRRALAIQEKTLGPEHAKVADVLEGLAALLRRTDRTAEAEQLEARATLIRAKHPQTFTGERSSR